MAIRSMSCGGYVTVSIQIRMCCAFVEHSNGPSLEFGKTGGRGVRMRVTMRDRSKNRKPLQKGRYLSIEAIQTVQALKRSSKSADRQQEVIRSMFSRLLKFDMIAILRELFRQDHSQLALMVSLFFKVSSYYKQKR